MVPKKLPNCALQVKSTKLGTMIILDGLISFSYGPHPNTQGEGHNVPLGGGVVAVLFWSGKNPEKGNKTYLNNFAFSFS